MRANDQLANHSGVCRLLVWPPGAVHGDAPQVFMSPGAAEQQAVMGMDPTQAQVRSLTHAAGKVSHEA